MTDYEAVIGLEVHAQLSTESKLFSPAATAFGASPNANIDVVCLGLPGVLPVLNEKAVELAVRAGLGLNCEVHPRSQWARKNYFYPDLPKGYQITQFEFPIATRGHLDVEVDGEELRVGITRIHMEEDAGKSVHDEAIAGDRSMMDFNRAGIPLIEIVSEPDIRTSRQASSYMRSLRQILRYLGVCDGNMEQGSLRCDANVSIRPRGQKELGTRAELKNINSFRFVEQAIDYEIFRQTEVLESGGEVVQETRLWDTQKKVTRSMRGKEEAHDYRYFPDPDLPDLVLEDGMIENLRSGLPELPAAKLERYQAEFSLSRQDGEVLVEDPEVARLFEEAVGIHNNPKALANWTINELLRELKDQPIQSCPVGPKDLAELVSLIDEGTISGKIAKDVFASMMAGEGAAREIVKSKGLEQVTDTGAIEAEVDAVLAENPDNVAKYKEGKTNLLGFFVGQVMKRTRGKANPKMVNELLREKLDG